MGKLQQIQFGQFKRAPEESTELLTSSGLIGKKQILQLELSTAKLVTKETVFSKAAVSAFRTCTNPVVHLENCYLLDTFVDNKE